MKQLLFLLLFPCFAMAQYQGNGNQKITLGEQTTADGLVWRGVENDTALITPFSDTSAYIILDTINNKFYNYNRSTNVWSLAGGGGGGGGTGTVTSITAGTGLTGGTITTSGTLAADTNFLVTRFDTSSMLNNYYRAGRSGIIQVADVPTLNQNTTGSAATLTTARNIRTNLASAYGANFDGSTDITPGVSGVLGAGNGGTGASNFGSPNRIPFVSSSGSLTTDTFFAYNGTTQRLGVGVPNPTEKLHVSGNGLFTGSMSLGTPLSVANGGTNTGTAFTAGSVVFAGASGTYTQDNSGLFWNNTSKRLGIGTSSPGYPIHIYSTGTTPAVLRISNAGSSVTSFSEFALETNSGYAAFFKNSSTNTQYGGVGSFNFGTISSENVAIMSNNTIRLFIAGGGSIGVGTLTPQANYRMHIVDSLYVGGRVSAAGYTTRSDYNLKEEIQTLNYGLNEVIQMQPVKYTYKSNGEQQLGFIAQDIGTLIPESVHFDEFMGVDYQSLIPILTKAIQEQQALIKALEQRILNLENK